MTDLSLTDSHLAWQQRVNREVTNNHMFNKQVARIKESTNNRSPKVKPSR